MRVIRIPGQFQQFIITAFVDDPCKVRLDRPECFQDFIQRLTRARCGRAQHEIGDEIPCFHCFTDIAGILYSLCGQFAFAIASVASRFGLGMS